jgi:hypothetical protein
MHSTIPLLYLNPFQDVVTLVEVVLKRSAHRRVSQSASTHVIGLTRKTFGTTAFQSHITGSEYTSAPARAGTNDITIPNKPATIRFTVGEPR